MSLNIDRVRELAEKELKEEREKEAKSKVKSKMKELETAKIVVSNIERELEDLYAELAQGN